ncbi:LLM class flavin-dependent oxidoreductase [Granulicella arctica]|uniref:LLM class flavin-dependent oxidoreductase n=1 Tax=Granulicella arctica TaxID=940613 RepID=UPI0021E0B354|nr:LLM class flavin-dependent oxidoreductase [Granulicella arctica]
MSISPGELRLSVLDQSPVSAGSTSADSLQRSISLARHVDALGYHRFWMSEHHAMETLACTAPEVMLARIGAETRRIRIGSGGIMLPHYTAFKVAECFRMLHALYPGRVDLGIGRAPGGGPVEALALKRDRTTQQHDDFPDQVSELLAFLGHDFPVGHPFARIQVSPNMPGSPDVWMLGSSMWSASSAAEFGLPYAFAHFFSPVNTRAAIEAYKRGFMMSALRDEPEAMVAVGVICADTQEEAEYLSTSVRLLQRRIRQGDRRPIASPEESIRELKLFGETSLQASQAAEEGEWPRYFVGTPERVKEELGQMATALKITEVVVNTIVWDHAARLRSYDLLAEAFTLTSVSPDRRILSTAAF